MSCRRKGALSSGEREIHHIFVVDMNNDDLMNRKWNEKRRKMTATPKL
jgi:hypothetical protein